MTNIVKSTVYILRRVVCMCSNCLTHTLAADQFYCWWSSANVLPSDGFMVRKITYQSITVANYRKTLPLRILNFNSKSSIPVSQSDSYVISVITHDSYLVLNTNVPSHTQICKWLVLQFASMKFFFNAFICPFSDSL